MKKLMLAAVVCLLVTTSCNQVAGWFGTEEDSLSTEFNHAAFSRDESITAANAYSDLFLDSTAIEKYINQQKLDDSSAQKIRNFYLVRNYQFAWFASNGLTEHGKNIWSLQSGDSAAANEKIQERMDSLLMNDSAQVNADDSVYQNTELELTSEFIDYANKSHGFINASNMYYMVPAKKVDAMVLADSLLNRNKDSALLSSNNTYSLLKQHLTHYYNAEKNGGWQPIPTGTAIQKGKSSPAVALLKKRLAATNDYHAGDTSSVYSDSLETAIINFQKRNGLAPDGTINDSLISILNVPAKERVQQILVNMNRAMWMQPISDSNRIVVNIPGYMLYAYSDSGKTLEMPVIVGKEGASTVIFNSEINQVVFNPTWNIPQRIVRDEIMPKMKTDNNYLEKRNMEIVNGDDSIPQIRQLPGKDNVMGRVKFLFPNTYDIYLHDTPEKSLFAKKERDLSHGCIRVQDPVALAEFILGKQNNDWSREKILSSMEGSEEQTVKLNDPVSVYITYNTAWVDENGQLNFRNDVYGLDKGTVSRMFL